MYNHVARLLKFVWIWLWLVSGWFLVVAQPPQPRTYARIHASQPRTHTQIRTCQSVSQSVSQVAASIAKYVCGGREEWKEGKKKEGKKERNEGKKKQGKKERMKGRKQLLPCTHIR
ncbi:hypothetical protein K504DRAFT_284427 [Pleomassaria siparia CBS 279.74]|uniref:Secreted protein n=1 Tax=Pleomassaria siparia CBS 279.74 TaxID=1314801 RepID=A0A6G1K7E4_9PLEO|nr:hypothetical protein K504DRAFT_284427 [Pleomassaria siparia CBS 279.74]